MTVSPTVATRPPSTVGSTMTLRLTLLAGGVGERGAQAVCWSGVSVDGGAHLGHLRSFDAAARCDEAVDDRRQVAGAAGPDHHRDQLHGGRRRLAAEQVLDDRLPAGRPGRARR